MQRKSGVFQSGQMGQTVNLLVDTFGGSNPSAPTKKLNPFDSAFLSSFSFLNAETKFPNKVSERIISPVHVYEQTCLFE